MRDTFDNITIILESNTVNNHRVVCLCNVNFDGRDIVNFNFDKVSDFLAWQDADDYNIKVIVEKHNLKISASHQAFALLYDEDIIKQECECMLSDLSVVIDAQYEYYQALNLTSYNITNEE